MPTKVKKLANAKRTGKSVKAKTIKPLKKAVRPAAQKSAKKNRSQTKSTSAVKKKPVHAGTKSSNKKTSKPLNQKSSVIMKKNDKKNTKKKVEAKRTIAPKKAVIKKPTPLKTKPAVSLTTVKTKPSTEKSSKPASHAIVGMTASMSNMGITPYKEKVNEEYMSEAQREHFRKILNKWRQDLLEEMDRTVHHLQDEAANFPDPNDRATQEEEFSLELRARDRERKLIKKIEEALQRIDENEYGYCESCGVEIGIRRLEARPTATLCIDCKTLDEIREKQLGG